MFDGGFARELHDVALISKWDPTHLNDVRVVTTAVAAKIDGVEAGDLLVSLRELHMLAILDSESGAIKWYRAGSWIRQHSPVMTRDGNIVVFDNGPGVPAPSLPIGSRLLLLDPATDETQVIFPATDQEPFTVP